MLPWSVIIINVLQFTLDDNAASLKSPVVLHYDTSPSREICDLMIFTGTEDGINEIFHVRVFVTVKCLLFNNNLIIIL